MSDELKPCPFCGETLLLKLHYGHTFNYVECKSCGAYGPNEPDNAWNTRTDAITSPDALIRAALEAVASPIYKWSIAAEEIEALASDPEAIARIIKAAEGRG